jgi:nitrite reductase (NADH) small subunit
MNNPSLSWLAAAPVASFPENGGACVLLNGKQIAIFNFTLKNKWYATDNECPHKHQMALSRGMIGDSAGEPKVACPFHKKTFSLESGLNLQGETYCINTYPVKVENGMVYVAL